MAKTVPIIGVAKKRIADRLSRMVVEGNTVKEQLERLVPASQDERATRDHAIDNVQKSIDAAKDAWSTVTGGDWP